MGGRNLKDIIVNLYNKGLGHYNGENTEVIFRDTNSWIGVAGNSLCFEKDAFFIMPDFDGGKQIILHGHLNE